MKAELEILEAEGYLSVRELPNGVVAGIRLMVYTAGLFVGLDATGYQRRYCYTTEIEATAALRAWDGFGDPPGKWIKEKPGDRLGPGATDES